MNVDPSNTPGLAAARRQHWLSQLARHAFQRPADVAVAMGERAHTWAELADRVARLAAGLRERGVGHGDRVALVMGNRTEYVETVLAINACGAAAVPINPRLSAAEIAYILDDCAPVLLVCDGDFGVLAADAGQRASRAPGLVDVAGEHGEAYDAVFVEAEAPTASGDGAAREVTEDDLALIMYTSGTTGRPKGAMLTHRNLQAQAQTNLIAFRFALDAEVTLCASPLFHIGAIGALAPAILVGATVVLMPTGAFDAGEVLDTMVDRRVTSLFLVPTQWQAVVDEQERAPRDLSRVRVASWGAAPASDALLRRMAAALPEADHLALFGQTEMSPVTCVLEGRFARAKIGSVGRPVPGVWMRVIDADGRDVEPGEIGEAVYRGPGVMRGYWRAPEATAEAFAGDWFHSGDLVRVDSDGFVFVVDRLKDMIISGGENVYCAEVENVLSDHPAVAEVAVIGRPHEVWGETPVAIVVPREVPLTLSLDDLRTFAAPRLARFKLPTGLEIRDVLPRNATGKVLKHRLRAP